MTRHGHPSAVARLQCVAIAALFAVAVGAGAADLPPARGVFKASTAAMSERKASILNNLRNHRATQRTRVAALDRASFNSDRLQLDLFADRQFVAEKMDIGPSGILARSWTGRLADGGSAAFVIHGDRVSGSIASTTGNYQVYPLGDGDVAIVEQDYRDRGECANGLVAKPPQPPGLQAPVINDRDVFLAATRRRSLAGPGTASLADTPTQNRVRVIVAYTADAQSLTSSVLGRTMQELIDLAVVESNQGYANSGVTMRMELACLYETTFNESAAIEDDVAAFRNSGDGVMDEIHTLRADYDADMCALIIDGTDPDWCGWAYDFDYTSYNNMFQATVYDCATGRFTFAHEFGHTQGCRHDTDGTVTPFAYAHGFRNGNNWRTIMAVAGSSTAPRLNYWSNPNINSPVAPFTAMGTPINGGNFASDNRSALNAGDNTVVDHESTPVSSFALDGDSVNSDESADKIVTSSLVVGTFNARAGSIVQFRSGSTIQLNPGFRAHPGSSFRARLAGPLGDAPASLSTTAVQESPDESSGQSPVPQRTRN